MFDKLIGNTNIKEYLKNSIKTQSYAQAYMFVGKEGIGKKLFASEFAKKIMCENKNIDNDNCESCIKFEGKANPDYSEIYPDGKSIKIEQIRELQRRISEKPIVSSKKVYIIDDADLMNEESQNCLLKTLEEPPLFAVIILIVSNESKILPTIKSRCIKIKFNQLKDEELKEFIPTLDENELTLLDGSLAEIEKIEQKKSDFEELSNIVKKLKNDSLIEIYNSSEILYTKKDEIIDLLKYLNLILLKENIINGIEIVEKTKQKILANNNYEMSIDFLLNNLWKTVNC